MTAPLCVAPRQRGIRITNKEKKDRYYAKLAAEETPDRQLKYFYNDARKSAARRGIEFSISEEYYRSVWTKQNGKCAVSGIPLTLTHGTRQEQNPTKVSTDRIDNSKGYIEGNIHLVTWQVNTAKGTWALSQLLELCKNIVNHNK